MAARTELWQRNDRTRAATLGPLGLPDDRAAWQELASSRPAGQPTAADNVVVEERIHAIRMRPEMYLNLTERDDPRLPGLIVTALIDAFSADNQSADWELVIESDLKFVLAVNGVAFNADSAHKRPSELTNVLTSNCSRNVQEMQIGVAAAWCATVHARTWYDGRIYEQEVVDLLPLRAAEHVGETTGTGHRIAFELDPQWLPPMSAITRDLDTHPRVHDQRASAR